VPGVDGMKGEKVI